MNMVRRILIGSLILWILIPVCRAGILHPDWSGDSGTTSQYFLFASDDNPAAPDGGSNPYGTTECVVDPDEVAAGWMAPDPNDPSNDFTYDGTGVWAIGPGTMQVDIPTSSTPAPLYETDLFVDIICFVDINQLPTLQIDGTVLSPSSSDTFEHKDEGKPGEWRHYTWSGLVEHNSPSLGVTVVGDLDSGSTIDTLSLETRTSPIPEPSAGLLMLFSAAVVLHGRRRSLS